MATVDTMKNVIRGKHELASISSFCFVSGLGPVPCAPPEVKLRKEA